MGWCQVSGKGRVIVIADLIRILNGAKNMLLRWHFANSRFLASLGMTPNNLPAASGNAAAGGSIHTKEAHGALSQVSDFSGRERPV
jgi:hypothetical protein